MLNEMKYVYAVYQERSFTKAAKKLYISQPALSSMVKKAEQEIGAPIFDRSTIPLSLTKEGRFYIQAARQIFTVEHNIQSYFDDIRHLETGTLSVGGSSFFCSFLLPELIGSFNMKHPKISIELFEGNIRELREGLDQEWLDLIIETAVQEGDPSLDTFQYKNETIVLAVPLSTPVNTHLTSYQLNPDYLCSGMLDKDDKPPVPLAELSQVPFVLLKPENDLGRRAVELCAEAGFAPKTAILVDQILTAVNISATGLGAAFVRPDAFRYLPIQKRFCFYRLGSPLASRNILFAAKKGRYLSSAMKAFLQAANAWKEEI